MAIILDHTIVPAKDKVAKASMYPLKPTDKQGGVT
jgi:hypothetical protein